MPFLPVPLNWNKNIVCYFSLFLSLYLFCKLCKCVSLVRCWRAIIFRAVCFHEKPVWIISIGDQQFHTRSEWNVYTDVAYFVCFVVVLFLKFLLHRRLLALSHFGWCLFFVVVCLVLSGLSASSSLLTNWILYRLSLWWLCLKPFFVCCFVMPMKNSGRIDTHKKRTMAENCLEKNDLLFFISCCNIIDWKRNHN